MGLKNAFYQQSTIFDQVLLSASEISEKIAQKRIIIEPFAPSLLRRMSYTVCLGDRWLRWKRSDKPIRMWSKNASKDHLEEIDNASSVVLFTGDFMLASTKEKIALPDDVGGIICTLSHIARFGLTATAGSLLIKPGYGAGLPKALTLEMSSLNPSPLEFPAGMPICHLAFFQLKQATVAQSKSVYSGQHDPCPPMLYEDMAAKIEELKNDEDLS